MVTLSQTLQGMRLKKTLLHFLLLFSLFFNIAHATVIAIEDDCHHESAHEYVAEQSASTECGDLCDMHHLFHFMAIVDTQFSLVNPTQHTLQLTHISVYKPSNFLKRNMRPPIA